MNVNGRNEELIDTAKTVMLVPFLLSSFVLFLLLQQLSPVPFSQKSYEILFYIILRYASYSIIKSFTCSLRRNKFSDGTKNIS